ncbi:MAG: GUN4 domain-containing protein [Phormidesmis sp. CAN_BIN44]|nr:GUN4 domain-containing protein [Phormidesmis sp. CAN_BIN44]
MSKTKNWAILVGINAYWHIGRLNYANRDAEAMRNFFYETKFDRVFCFADKLEIPPQLDQQSAQPRLTDLVDFLHDRFTTKPPPLASSDNCWFFFAGHGKRVNDCDYLLPQDYNPRLSNHVDRAISVDFVRESLLKSGAGNVILLLDACRTEEGDRSDSWGISDQQPGAITIFSCQRNQKAWEIDALQQGAFTAALLEGLRMSGERNCATVERLDLYLRDRVPELCRLYQKLPEQNPMTSIESPQKSHLILLPQYATIQDIKALKIEAFKAAQFDENLDLSEELWKRVNAASLGRDYDAIRALQKIAVQRENEHLNRLNNTNTGIPLVAQINSAFGTVLNISTNISTISAPNELASEKDIDYSNLRDLLVAEKWQAADRETDKLMFRAAGLEADEIWPYEEKIENFPCADLRTINQLWLKYSAGHFGFSVQKQIWEEVRRNHSEFGRAVGWEVNDEWLLYSQMTFDRTAPQGHLPTGKFECSNSTDWNLSPECYRLDISTLFYRVETCQITGEFKPTNDYQDLKSSLATGDWRTADGKTYVAMCHILGIAKTNKATDEVKWQKDTWIGNRQIKSFPSSDLQAINQLWLEYSKGHFGFSVQKQIWEESGRSYERFVEAVGWKFQDRWIRNYSDMTFSISAPKGHLPFLTGVDIFWGAFERPIGMWATLLSRPDL